MRIYLDHAATTPIEPEVSRIMRDFELEYFGNPNSIHREGQAARAKIDTARAQIAAFFSAKPQEIIFTSGATEANNLAIQGVILADEGSLRLRPHVITTLLEHQSVYNTVKALKDRGLIEATFIKPSKEGIIKAKQVLDAVRENTILISVIFVSNEIGTILPIREISKGLIELQPKTYNLKPIFHTDAVQAVKYLNCNVEKLGVDLMTISAHKIGGPKGVGSLYVKSGTKLKNLMLGGSQEYGLRPGTQNTAGIIGFAKAIELLGSLEERQKTAERVKKLRDMLLEEIQKINMIEVNGPVGDNRSVDNINFTIFNFDQDLLLAKLDLAGIAASTGSACVSGSTEASHVIKALGKVGKRQAATVRLTLGKNNTESEIKNAIKILKTILK